MLEKIFKKDKGNMFENFLKFVNEDSNQKINSVDEFLKKYNGKSFLDGMYRLHYTKDIEKWNNIVAEAFPPCAGKIKVFGYDWLGSMFAIDLEDNNILLFELGGGEGLKIPVNFVDFHNVEIVEKSVQALSSDYFKEWREANDNYVIPHDKCVGYKVPLFLNGVDEIENLEVSDLEVYWGIMGQLINTYLQ